jgi:2',3'-cyclic-nucleotide 2'-phosphodiesterase (5'-nucleotidase family)
MREAVPGADAAFGNAGSVRDVLPEGDLTFGQLLHVMPFDNQLAKLHLSGKQLRAMVAENLAQGEHGLLSLSGVTVDASCKGAGLDVTLKHPDGAAIRDDEQLTVVTNDFLALGGDGLVGPLRLRDANIEILQEGSVLTALISGLTRRKIVSPEDPMLLDTKHPRMKLGSEIPIRCGK